MRFHSEPHNSKFTFNPLSKSSSLIKIKQLEEQSGSSRKGDVEAAEAQMPRACKLWAEADIPYEAAQARVQLGQAYQKRDAQELSRLELMKRGTISSAGMTRPCALYSPRTVAQRTITLVLASLLCFQRRPAQRIALSIFSEHCVGTEPKAASLLIFSSMINLRHYDQSLFWGRATVTNYNNVKRSLK